MNAVALSTDKFTLFIDDERQGVWFQTPGYARKPGWYVTRFGETDGPFSLEEAEAADAFGLRPFRKFGETLPSGLNWLEGHRANVASRRQMPNGGFHETFDYHRAKLTAFAESRARCEEIVAMLLRRYPEDAYYTRFSTITEIDGEFIAYGSRVLENMRIEP